MPKSSDEKKDEEASVAARSETGQVRNGTGEVAVKGTDHNPTSAWKKADSDGTSKPGQQGQGGASAKEKDGSGSSSEDNGKIKPPAKAEGEDASSFE